MYVRLSRAKLRLRADYYLQLKLMWQDLIGEGKERGSDGPGGRRGSPVAGGEVSEESRRWRAAGNPDPMGSSGRSGATAARALGQAGATRGLDLARRGPAAGSAGRGGGARGGAMWRTRIGWRRRVRRRRPMAARQVARWRWRAPEIEEEGSWLRTEHEAGEARG